MNNYYLYKYKFLKTEDFMIKLYWYLGKLKEYPLGCKDICDCEVFFFHAKDVDSD